MAPLSPTHVGENVEINVLQVQSDLLGYMYFKIHKMVSFANAV